MRTLEKFQLRGKGTIKWRQALSLHLCWSLGCHEQSSFSFGVHPLSGTYAPEITQSPPLDPPGTDMEPSEIDFLTTHFCPNTRRSNTSWKECYK